MQEPLSPLSTAFGALDAASSDLIRSIVDNVPTMIAYFDRTLLCRYANASYRQLFEKPGQPLEGAPFASLVQPNMRDDILPRAQAALRGEPQSFEYERLTPTGQRLQVEVRYRPDLRQGEVHGLFVELHDITHHKRIEDLVLEANRDLEERVQERTAKLFESEQRFRLMVDGLQDYCIYFLDADGNITDWTDSAQRLHAIPPHLALRQHLGLLLDASHPGSAPAALGQLLRQAIDNGHAESDGWQVREGQPPFWAHTTLTALRNGRGELQGLSAITKDMTAAKRLEAVMADLNQELESRIQSRTRELTMANRDIDAFAHMVSHDLRAPLRHISGFVTLLREDLNEHINALPAPVAHTMTRHLEAVDQSNRRLAKMIESVLEYARLGRTTLTATAVDLGTVVHAQVGYAQTAAGDRTVEWVVPSQWPQVQGDASLLGKLLGCLLDNALKYTRHTPAACIEMGWRHANPSDPQPSGYPQGEPRTIFWVTDNGAGFDRERATNLFVMFQRQHHSMDFEGTGTGLALSQRIVALHGGTIRADSQPGKGCTVSIGLPT
jgi:PAS domain S-box-containing protein